MNLELTKTIEKNSFSGSAVRYSQLARGSYPACIPIPGCGNLPVTYSYRKLEY